MGRIARASLTTGALLFFVPASPAQAPVEKTAKVEPASVNTPCTLAPGGNSLRLACPLPAVVFEDAESSLLGPEVPIALKLPEGTPLRIAIDQRTRISHVGESVLGHVVQAVFAFDEPVIPVGTIATGHVTAIAAVPKLRRMSAYASGDFSPFRQYAVTFDQLELPNGILLPINTAVAPGATEVVHLVAKESKGKDEDQTERKSAAARAVDAAKQGVKDGVHEANVTARQAADQIREPGRMQRLKQYFVSQSPYRRQYVTVGTRFSATLNDGLDFGSGTRTREELSSLGNPPPTDTVLHARLVMELSSETAERGNPVVAQLTEPIYSADHRLLLPADSRLIGIVLEAKPARRLHRNGELRVIFERIELPGGALEPVQGTLEGLEVDRAAHLKLDEEGGAHATDSRMRYLTTGAALLLAAVAANPTAEHGVGEQADDPAIRAGAGASGFGLAGTVIGLLAKSNGVTIAFSAYGATASIYTNFLSRGRNVVLPKNAPLEIGLGTSHPASRKH